jgi:hypothetical protein
LRRHLQVKEVLDHLSENLFLQTSQTQTTEGLNFEGLHYALQTIPEAHDNIVSAPPENQDITGEEETPDEEASSPPILGHLVNNIFQENFETVHPYNTQSKSQNKLSPETSRNVV